MADDLNSDKFLEACRHADSTTSTVAERRGGGKRRAPCAQNVCGRAGVRAPRGGGAAAYCLTAAQADRRRVPERARARRAGAARHGQSPRSARHLSRAAALSTPSRDPSASPSSPRRTPPSTSPSNPSQRLKDYAKPTVRKGVGQSSESGSRRQSDGCSLTDFATAFRRP